jgi:uroporphyrin-3 C-methyltransferase
VLIDARRITSQVDLPLLVDADTGWGGAFNIARTVKQMTAAGVAGMHIEDQVSQKRCGHRPNKEVVSTDEMVDRVKAAGTVDVQSLAIRIDETVRAIDDLPLLAAIDRRGAQRDATSRAAGERASDTASSTSPAAAARPTAGASAAGGPGPQWLDARVRSMLHQVWSEVRDLVRVTRVDEPEAALLAPEQAYFLRENLKLRLLNARLALLSRQFDTVQADLRDAQASLDRYFDKGSRRVELAREQLRQVAQQARQVTVPRPDATLAALATAVAGR